ncbi:hypothetical protein ACFWYW_48465 [Nonomuraea sp. NPDC059023]|uniref:hypothetical protein n=1 Tax=unclassified Nonomuraea TaxID=2593643 RepID=UPI0036836FB8
MNNYFGIITRDGARHRARVEVPNQPDVIVVTDSAQDAVRATSDALASLLGIPARDVSLQLFGYEGDEGAQIYAGAAVFDGDQWLTQFPAQEDLPVALVIPPSPAFEIATARVRTALASALGRPEDSLDIEFFQITPDKYLERPAGTTSVDL